MSARRALTATLLIWAATGCSGQGDGGNASMTASTRGSTTVTIRSGNGAHAFTVDTARTPAEQERGLMFRTGIPRDGGMLFAPYPPDGGAPQVANFWMKNTPSPLDIVFIRQDRTIARIAENTIPLSESPVSSDEPVAAVLEINGGRAAELGIAQGDAVSWDE